MSTSADTGIELNFTQQYPELSNCIITALLWSLGDLIAQLFEYHSSPRKTHLPLTQSPSPSSSNSYAPSLWSFNYLRTLRIASYAGLIFAPITKRWFETLEIIFPGAGLEVAIKRMLLDQLLYSSCVIVSLFIWVSVWEAGCNAQYIWNKIRTNYRSTILANWMLWPFVQLVLQSGLIPLEYRMMVGALVNVPWTAYLAWRSASHSATAMNAPLELGVR